MGVLHGHSVSRRLRLFGCQSGLSLKSINYSGENMCTANKIGDDMPLFRYKGHTQSKESRHCGMFVLGDNCEKTMATHHTDMFDSCSKQLTDHVDKMTKKQ